jgi:site-specific DNA-cytosine methylase
MRILELFAGIGGVGFGIEAAGHITVQAVERDDIAAHYYRLNHPHVNVYADDIWRVPLEWYKPVDMIWLSPPCTEDSISKTTGTRNESVARAGEAFIPVLYHFRDGLQRLPSMVILENVPQYQANPSYGAICAALLNCGYTLQSKIVEMERYAVPSSRRRLILVARLDGRFHWPKPTNQVSWYEATEDLIAGYPIRSMPEWVRSRWHSVKSLPALINTQASKYMLIDGQLNYGKGRPERGITVRAAHQTATCVVASASSAKMVALDLETMVRPDGAFYARLMAFPDTVILPTVKEHAIRLIGNAVPPLFVQSLLEAMTDTSSRSIWTVSLWGGVA